MIYVAIASLGCQTFLNNNSKNREIRHIVWRHARSELMPKAPESVLRNGLQGTLAKFMVKYKRKCHPEFRE